MTERDMDEKTKTLIDKLRRNVDSLSAQLKAQGWVAENATKVLEELEEKEALTKKLAIAVEALEEIQGGCSPCAHDPRYLTPRECHAMSTTALAAIEAIGDPDDRPDSKVG